VTCNCLHVWFCKNEALAGLRVVGLPVLHDKYQWHTIYYKTANRSPRLPLPPRVVHFFSG